MGAGGIEADSKIQSNCSTDIYYFKGARMKNIKMIIAIMIMLQCVGCTFTAQSVKISPEVKSTSNVTGNGHSVELTVADERPSKVIGQRGVGGVGADITVEGDLQTIVSNAIVSGLTKHNFAIAAQAVSDASKLRIEIRNLDSKNIMGFWSGTLRDEFSLKAICKSPGGAEYQKLFNGIFETSIQVVPTGEANNKYLSAAVSDGVNQLVNDDGLLKCLAP
jgi:uncharacterized lipoprotein YajG